MLARGEHRDVPTLSLWQAGVSGTLSLRLMENGGTKPTGRTTTKEFIRRSTYRRMEKEEGGP
ncbi:unnamed protein product [Arctogadus glacialis]